MKFLIALVVLNFALVLGNVIREEVANEKSPEEGDLFEGDIAGVTLVDNGRGAAQIVTSTRVKWPGGVVPYVFDAVFSEAHKDTFLTGMKIVEDQTRIGDRDCIKFVPRTVETTYIRVINDTGCYSYVGKQVATGIQNLSLRVPGCLVLGTIAHEFIHALGFWHEQSRPDRDDYIRIVWDKITTANQHNFNKYDYSKSETLGFPYDYGSVMHYGEKSFSIDGSPTIVPLQEGVIIGQRVRLSEIDVAEIRAYYNCK